MKRLPKGIKLNAINCIFHLVSFQSSSKNKLFLTNNLLFSPASNIMISSKNNKKGNFFSPFITELIMKVEIKNQYENAIVFQLFHFPTINRESKSITFLINLKNYINSIYFYFLICYLIIKPEMWSL